MALTPDQLTQILNAIQDKTASHRDVINTIADTLITTSTFFAAIVTGILVAPQNSPGPSLRYSCR